MKYRKESPFFMITNFSWYLFSFLLLFVLFNTETHSQFNTLIFKRQFHLNPSVYAHDQIQSLGDLNGDGNDDFLVYDCYEKKSFIFFGGNPIDTIPKFVISSFQQPIAIVDLNDDHKKDIVFYDYPNKKILIYFGGAILNSKPDIIFSPPPGASNNFGGGTVLKDFNGDGRSELVIDDPNLPYSSKQFGTFYFYNTGSVFDTIPHYILKGDMADSVRYFNIDSQGDINGDGLTDFTLYGYQSKGGVDHYFRNFYLGNIAWNFTPAATYYSSDIYPYPMYLLNPEYMHITSDLNKDGKDDIIIQDYGFYHIIFRMLF